MLSHRKKTQPLNAKSAGCAFRNPSTGLSAGALIDQCRLKGFCLGGAKVSEVHANFIVNASNATQSDVVQLIALIQEKVFLQTGVLLEPEVRMIGPQ
jgi:UDP-N-acetylmuramate dehydrogenase